MYKPWFLALLCVALISGCGDSQGKYTLLSNTNGIFVVLDDLQVITGGSPDGSATADVRFNRDDGSLSGKVTLNGLEADSVTLNLGFAGQAGTLVVALAQDSLTEWSLPADLILTTAQTNALDSGGLYLKMTTTAYPDGALRGQIVPGGIEVYFTKLTGSEVVPAVNTAASAVAALTVDTNAQAITVHINTLGLLDAVSASIFEGLAGENGSLIIDLSQDSGALSHWFVENLSLTSAQYTALETGEIYFVIATPAWTAGEVRGQLLLGDGTLPTLSSIQDRVFTPSCASAGCHRGVVPSAGLDLTLGKSYSQLINVNSTQVPGILLVKPGDSANSYLIHKIDGTFTEGGLMPVRRSLTTSQIQIVKQWVDGGALNN